MKIFKRTLDEVLIASGFSKKSFYYCREGVDCICVLSLQRSYYSSGYYINIGYVLKGLHKTTDNLKEASNDITSRFTFTSGGINIDFFDLEKLADGQEELIRECFVKNITDLVEPALLVGGINKLLAERPVMLYTTTLAAKKFLDRDA